MTRDDVVEVTDVWTNIIFLPVTGSVTIQTIPILLNIGILISNEK